MSKRHKRHARKSKIDRQKLNRLKAQSRARRAKGGRGGPPPTQPMPRTRPAPKPRSYNAETGADSELASKLRSSLNLLETRERSLNSRSDLGTIRSEVAKIEESFFKIPADLNTLNRRGFPFTQDIEDELAIIEDAWENGLKHEVATAIETELNNIDVVERQSERLLDRLSGSRLTESAVNQAETEVENWEEAINSAERRLRDTYRSIKDEIDEMLDDIEAASGMLDLLNDSEIALRGSEAPVLATKAEWERDGEDEGPDGYLFLTDQRLLFEQKEMVATKKLLFVTTEKKEVQKLWVDVELQHIESIDHSEERRGMLRMGRDEILSLVLSGNADYSRLRFHIQEGEADEWVETIKLVLSGEIEADRFDFDSEEETVDFHFPAECPNCLAAIPPQPAGVKNYQCEFCGATIQAIG